MARFLSYCGIVVFGMGGVIALTFAATPTKLPLVLVGVTALLATGMLMGYWWDK